MQNIPQLKLGLVAVSRDCFEIELSKKRKAALIKSCENLNISIVDIETVIENETDALKAEKELCQQNVNALVLFLGNFGPEGPTTILAQKFNGPVMLIAAAEENTACLASSRGDAYCGMLNASYNLGLRNINAYIPDYPVGTSEELASMISEFMPVARVLIALKKLKM